MSKKDIYAASYDAEPKDNSKILEAIQSNQMHQKNIRNLGRMLKEERTRAADLQRRVNRLEEEKQRLVQTVTRLTRR